MEFGQGFRHAAVEQSVPRVIWVCPTFRKDEEPHNEAYRARFEGLVSLYEQFRTQNYPGNKIELRIADASATPHPFFLKLRDPRVTYLHVPSRDPSLKSELQEKHPEAAPFLLTNEELVSDDMRERIWCLHQYCSRKLDPESASMIPSIPDPYNVGRPSIGMKRNMLCALPFTADGGVNHPDIIISADDDDWRSADYTKNRVADLDGSDWTKLVNYHLAIYMSDDDSFRWGKKDFSVNHAEDTDTLPGLTFSQRAVMFKKGEGFSYVDPDQAFKSPRWHPLSTDGAVHALRHDAWRRTVELFGGYAPVSYNEDTIMFEALRSLGNLSRIGEVERHKHVTGALVGKTIFTEAQLEKDAALGPVKFSPSLTDRFEFLRLCCANVSPVAFSELVGHQEIPHNLHNSFSFVKQNKDTVSHPVRRLEIVG